MTTSNQTHRASIIQATSPSIVHVAVGTTEISHPLTGNVKKLLIQNTGPTDIKLSWVLGGTGSSTDEFIEIPSCASRDIGGIEFSGTIYLLAGASQTVYIEQWV